MKGHGERWFMALLFTGLPLVAGLVLMPSLRRVEALRQRLRVCQEALQQGQPCAALSAEERILLEPPQAKWRTRIPRLDDDGARLAHLDRVVAELNAALAAKKLSVLGMRASWAPLVGSFTLPARGLDPAPPEPAALDSPESQLSGWVLEVELGGGTAALFQALAVLPGLDPLLEPVGLRWASPAGEHHQYLQLRNLYLKS